MTMHGEACVEILRQADRLARELGGATAAELALAVGAGVSGRESVRDAIEMLMQIGDLEVIDYVAGRPRYVPTERAGR